MEEAEEASTMASSSQVQLRRNICRALARSIGATSTFAAIAMQETRLVMRQPFVNHRLSITISRNHRITLRQQNPSPGPTSDAARTFSTIPQLGRDALGFHSTIHTHVM